MFLCFENTNIVWGSKFLKSCSKRRISMKWDYRFVLFGRYLDLQFLSSYSETLLKLFSQKAHHQRKTVIWLVSLREYLRCSIFSYIRCSIFSLENTAVSFLPKDWPEITFKQSPFPNIFFLRAINWGKRVSVFYNKINFSNKIKFIYNKISFLQ